MQPRPRKRAARPTNRVQGRGTHRAELRSAAGDLLRWAKPRSRSGGRRGGCREREVPVWWFLGGGEGGGGARSAVILPCGAGAPTSPHPPHHPVLWSELLHAPHVRTVLSRRVRRDLGNGGDICGGPSWGFQHAKREGTHAHWTGSREECQASDMSSRLGCLCWRGERTVGRQDVSQAGNLFLTCLAVSRPGFRHGICTGCQETEAVVLKRPATGSSPRQRVFVAGGVTIWRDRGRGAAVDFTGAWSVPVPGTALLRSGGCTHM